MKIDCFGLSGGSYPRAILLFFMVLALSASALTSQASTARPNVLVIVADDLGYSDLGSYGGEIETPVLDKIASEGLRFSNFHVLATCAPTRSVFITGTDNHVAGMGSQLPTDAQREHPGYAGYLREDVITLPEILSNNGYRTYHSGKWHLGYDISQGPHARGFQQNFSLIPGGASHHADMLPLNPSEPTTYRINGQVIKELPKDFYSTRNYTDFLIDSFEKDKESDKPFFAYLAYTAPHDPLHAPKAYVEKYGGVYDDGFHMLRDQRIEGLEREGLIREGLESPKWPSVIRTWESLSDIEKKNKIRDMQVYAGMVDYMDEQIGRIYDWLASNGQLENTLIIFFSDNGASGFSATAYPGQTAEFLSQFDNSYDNRGEPSSRVEMGSGWAVASSGPYRLFKGFLAEGGIRTPAIIRFPGATAPGSVSNSFVHVSDLMPTILEYAGIVHPEVESLSPRYKLAGISVLDLLAKVSEVPQIQRSMGYEIHAAGAYYEGDWKIMQNPVPMGSGRWELFNIKDDPYELNNLAFKEKEKLSLMIERYQRYEKDVGIVHGIPGPIGKFYWVFTTLTSLLMILLVYNAIILLSSSINISHVVVSVVQVGAVLLVTTDYYVIAIGLALIGAVLTITLMHNKRSARFWSIQITLIVLALLYLYFVSGQVVRFMLG